MALEAFRSATSFRSGLVGGQGGLRVLQLLGQVIRALLEDGADFQFLGVVDQQLFSAVTFSSWKP
jgi:hypothetical protein